MSLPEITDPPEEPPLRNEQDEEEFISAWNDFLAWLFVFVAQIKTAISWIGDQLTAAAQAVADARNAVPFETWSDLAAATGMSAGDRATVIASDTGTHTDPVVGGTVSNSGIYEYSEDPAGWERIADLDSALAAAQAALSTTERQAAQTAAGIANAVVNYTGGYDGGTLYAIGESVDFEGRIFAKRSTAAAGTEPIDGPDWLQMPDVVPPDEQVFTESGTWNRPDDEISLILLRLWGAGESGSARTESTGQIGTFGGDGGGFKQIIVPASLFGETVAVVVGAGGAPVHGSTPGNAGGSSSFGPISVPGGGAPSDGSFGEAQSPGDNGSGTSPARIFAGTGGAGIQADGDPQGAPGASVYGGQGGTSLRLDGAGAAGSGATPGGGGGARVWSTASDRLSGAGGNGRVEVYSW